MPRLVPAVSTELCGHLSAARSSSLQISVAFPGRRPGSVQQREPVSTPPCVRLRPGRNTVCTKNKAKNISKVGAVRCMCVDFADKFWSVW